jgi:hypothetical protein
MGRRSDIGMDMSKQSQQKLVDEWNAAYPIGTEVRCVCSDGYTESTIYTRTESSAFVFFDGRAVIFVVGMFEHLDLSQVAPYYS